MNSYRFARFSTLVASLLVLQLQRCSTRCTNTNGMVGYSFGKYICDDDDDNDDDDDDDDDESTTTMVAMIMTKPIFI